jgi:hypothetical protein
MDLSYSKIKDLIGARDALNEAQEQFYKTRADFINTYPMKNKDISPANLEALYDKHVGSEPWKYTSSFATSGSTPKIGNYPSGATSAPPDVLWTNTNSVFWIQNYPNTPATTPSSGYPYIFDPPYAENPSSTTLLDPKGPWLYNSAVGAPWIDIILAKDGSYTKAFDSMGTVQNYTHHSYTNSVNVTAHIEYVEGFGEVPYAYNGTANLSAFEVHMRKLVGDAWDAACKTKFDAYTTEYNAYVTEYGLKNSFTFISGSSIAAWAGYKQSEGALLFNRPGKLNVKLVNETRGINS